MASVCQKPCLILLFWGPPNLSAYGAFFLFVCFNCLFEFYWSCCMTCGILVPGLGMETMPPTSEAWNCNHWTTREIPKFLFYFSEVPRKFTRFKSWLWKWEWTCTWTLKNKTNDPFKCCPAIV